MKPGGTSQRRLPQIARRAALALLISLLSLLGASRVLHAQEAQETPPNQGAQSQQETPPAPPAPPAQSAQLQPFQASYLWYWHGAAIAFSRLELTHQGDDLWMYSSSTRPRGLGRLYPMRPDLQSLMRITPEHVLPLHFKVTGTGHGHDSNVSFDWQALRATGLYEGVKIDEAITPGVQDDLSVQIAMLTKLIAGQTPDVVMEIAKDGVREYDYERQGEEQLTTALGRIETIVYASHHPGSPRTTRFWCAPSLGYIPLQVQQEIDQHHGTAIEWTMRIHSLVHQP